MVKRISLSLLLLILFILACEDVKRVWDNPYDPRSDRSTWTPDSLKIGQISDNLIELKWVSIGKPADGFKIDKKIGPGEWIDTISVLPYNVLKWQDKIDLKEVVNDPQILTYRLYAYADSNISNYQTIKIFPASPAPPLKVNIKTIVRDPADRKLKIDWNESIDADFLKYIIKYKPDNDTVVYIYKEFSTVSNTKHDSILSDTSLFIYKKNIFFVETVDTTNQSTLGDNYILDAALEPSPVRLDSIIYDKEKEQLNLSWTKSNSPDFNYYFLEKKNNNEENYSVVKDTDLDTIKIVDQNAILFNLDIQNNLESYLRVVVKDVWGQASSSNFNKFSTFPRIVKLNNIQDFGDLVRIEKYYCGCDQCCEDIDVSNKSTSEFSFKTLLLNEYIRFPQWIDNGNMIFGFRKGKVGIIINKDGSLIKEINSAGSIFGDNYPTDMSFNSSGSRGIFTGDDHNIWTVDLINAVEPVSFTSFSANEWYQDPEFLEDGRMLFSQKELTKDNQGISDIYIMNQDANKDSRVKLTSAKNRQKFIMPRKIPFQSKILYVNNDVSANDEGLYELDYLISDQGSKISSIVPDRIDFFKNIIWSPNGKNAVIVANANIYIYNSETSTIALLEIAAKYPSWLNDEEVYFKKTDTDLDIIYKKRIDKSQDDTAIIFYKGETDHTPWIQIQPR